MVTSYIAEGDYQSRWGSASLRSQPEPKADSDRRQCNSREKRCPETQAKLVGKADRNKEGQAQRDKNKCFPRQPGNSLHVVARIPCCNKCKNAHQREREQKRPKPRIALRKLGNGDDQNSRDQTAHKGLPHSRLLTIENPIHLSERSIWLALSSHLLAIGVEGVVNDPLGLVL